MSKIIEEEQRLRPLHDQVVHAHRDQINANRAMLAAFDGDLFGADAVVWKPAPGR
jgi:hypothetical protein